MRKILLIGTFIGFAIAIASSVYVLGKSMSLSEGVLGRRPVIDASGLGTGEYSLKDLSDDHHANLKVLSIRDWNGTLSIYLLPSKDGKITMPDTGNGWWGYYHCSNFSPEMASPRKIRKSGKIVCHDRDARAWNSDEWAWRYDGTPYGKGGNVPPMMRPNVERIGDSIYLNL